MRVISSSPPSQQVSSVSPGSTRVVITNYRARVTACAAGRLPRTTFGRRVSSIIIRTRARRRHKKKKNLNIHVGFRAIRIFVRSLWNIYARRERKKKKKRPRARGLSSVVRVRRRSLRLPIQTFVVLRVFKIERKKKKIIHERVRR